MKISFILSLVMAILVAIFALLNPTTVPVNFLFAKPEMPLALLIFISVAIGAVIGMFIDMVGKFKIKKTTKELNKQISVLKAEKDEIETKSKGWETKFKEQELLVKEKTLELEQLRQQNAASANAQPEIKSEEQKA